MAGAIDQGFSAGTFAGTIYVRLATRTGGRRRAAIGTGCRIAGIFPAVLGIAGIVLLPCPYVTTAGTADQLKRKGAIGRAHRGRIGTARRAAAAVGGVAAVVCSVRTATGGGSPAILDSVRIAGTSAVSSTVAFTRWVNPLLHRTIFRAIPTPGRITGLQVTIG